MANIEKRPDGVWRARYYDETGKQHAKHFGRKVDAKAWLDEVTASVVIGTYVDPKAGRVTFTSFYEDWRERQVWVPGTRRAMDLAAGSVAFGNVPLSKIRKSHVEMWVKGMVVKDLAVGTIHTRAQNVRSVLRAAVEDRVIPRGPSVGVTLPRRRRAEASMEIPTTQTVGKILAAADSDFVAFVALCAFAGLRLGEAAAVQLGDVDFLRRTLAVSRQVQRVNGGAVEIRAPKYGSERTVFLASELVKILARHVGLASTGRGRLAICRTGRSAATPEHGRTPLAEHVESRWPEWRSAPRPEALLRLRLDRCGVRRRYGPAGARPLKGDDDFGHLLAPVAHR